jgi:membrane complex biogenesis BtpA family protein
MDRILDRASREAAILAEEGLNGVLVENFSDTPFWPDRVPPETVAAMAVAVQEITRTLSVPVGVNVLRNDAGSALAIAAATGADFIRVNVHTGVMFTDQGILEGKAAETLRKRVSLGPGIQILADVLVKHATPPGGITLEAAARDTWNRGRPDGIIVTGAETGRPVDVHEIQSLRSALPEGAKVWVGSGVTPQTASMMVREADGLIVGSALQSSGVAGAGIERPRVRELMDALRGE